jgi:predicted acetyltransferase
MPLSMRWIGPQDYDALARARLLCYGNALKELAVYRERITLDARAKPGDFLLAERDGLPVGTLTSLSMVMWVRGTPVPCQGVAYVGTIKTHRRAGSGNEKGIASQLMAESLEVARRRGEIVSALMPFRASFYEHFGYGFAETRVEWTVPLSVLPTGEFNGARFAEPQDFPAMEACRQRQVQHGQCDIESSAASWANRHRNEENGLVVIDRVDPDKPIASWMFLVDEKRDGKTMIRVSEHAADSHAMLLRQLHFLSSLKDQYSAAIITLPGDLPLNRILRETQIPHRPVEHGVSQAKPYTRMQIRVLDHKRWVEAMKLPTELSAKATIAVRECEGAVSKFRIDLSAGKALVSPSDASADVEMTDVSWASISSGDISASAAARLGLIQVNQPSALPLLDAFSAGPSPFCREYF